MHCIALQHTATHYKPLVPETHTCKRHSPNCNTLQHAASHCNTLQRTATHCNALQHTTNYLYQRPIHVKDTARTATRCNTLHRTATHCNTLQRTATHCNTLQTTCTRDPYMYQTHEYICRKETYIYRKETYVCGKETWELVVSETHTCKRHTQHLYPLVLSHICKRDLRMWKRDMRTSCITNHMCVF